MNENTKKTANERFGTIQGSELERKVKRSFEPCMIEKAEQPPYGVWVFPSNDLSKLRYSEIANLVNPARTVLRALPENQINLEEIGYYPEILSLEKREINFSIQDIFTGYFNKGILRNLGFNRFGIMINQKRIPAHHVIGYLHQGLLGLTKLKVFDGKPFPHHSIGRTREGESESGGKECPQEYREFVGKILEKSDEVKVNPKLFKSFDNYQIYRFGGLYVAYNPRYGEGIYIANDENLFFMCSKSELRKSREAVFIPRARKSDWQTRVWRIIKRS